MSRLGGWFRAAAPKLSASPSPGVDTVAKEIAMMEDAMASASLIMNDDIDAAEEKLRKGDSTFHLLGQSLCTFMRSVLGFEKSIMVEASERLYQCETRAWDEMKKAQREAGGSAPPPGRIYPPGSEFALIHAEAQLMSAVVAVLHESLTEGVKGFYKLRKAFLTLDGLMQEEDRYLKSRGLRADGSKENVSAAGAPSSSSSSSTSEKKPAESPAEDDDADLEFVDADEARQPGTKTPLTYEGHVSNNADLVRKAARLSMNGDAKKASSASPRGAFSSAGSDSDIFTHPIDIFVHSGTNMCFGILLLIISMVPPAFSRLLSIIGFRGDRERGVHMLWRSTQYDNINGGVAGLMLFAYYNGLIGFSDILPNDEDIERGAIVGYPRERCAALLGKMRDLFPDSGLWRLEEARALSNGRDLHGAMAVLRTNAASKMRQVTALNSFELSLDAMYVQDYDEMRDSFLRCVELNDWSHALYYYLAGCAELENYRDALHGRPGEGQGGKAAEAGTARDESAIRNHKKRAEELFRKAPSVVGKKKFMARPMPFEQFVSRKLQRWEECARALGLDLADAAGVCPALEMTYLWNGTRKMNPADLETALARLDWDRLTAPAGGPARRAIMDEPDERAVRDVCAAAVLRNLGRFPEARAKLQGVLDMDRAVFKGANRDDYPPAAAHYEMAVLAWTDVQSPELHLEGNAPASGAPSPPPPEAAVAAAAAAAEKKEEGGGGGGGGEEREGGNANGNAKDRGADEEAWRRRKLDECQSWLETVSKWEGFILDARLGMRINTGLDTIRWYRKEHGWAAAD